LKAGFVAAIWSALCVAVMPLTAQQAAADSLAPWRLSYFPYVTVSPNDGAMLVARVLLFRQSAADDRVSLRDAVAFEGGYSVHNAWRAGVRGDFPRLAPGWRLEAEAVAGRTPRFGDPDAPQALTRQYVGGELTRSIAGHLAMALRVSAEHLRDDLDAAAAAAYYPATIVNAPCLGQTDCAASVDQTDLRGRVALIFDTRNREYDTRQGILMQAGVLAGSAADGYAGGYALGAGWISLDSGTTLTARVGGRSVSRTQAIGVQQTIPAWEDEFVALGGPQSDRALAAGEDPGQGVLLAGAELRHALVRYKGIAMVSIFVFADGGRSFRDSLGCDRCLSPVNRPANTFELTFDGWTVGAGGGVAVRVLRNAQLTLSAARADHATRWYLSSGWSW
jgi:hypothetical protein